jgi:hypothetical protein
LHSPNVISFWAKCFGGVGFDTGIDEYGFAVDVDNDVADVVVIVAFGVVTAFGGNVKTIARTGCVACGKELNAVEPNVAGKGYFGFGAEQVVEGEGGGQKSTEAVAQGALAQVTFLCGPGTKCSHVGISNGFAIAIGEGCRGRDNGGGIGKVDKIIVGNLCAVDKLAHVANEGLGIDIDGAVGGTLQEFEVVK